MKHYKQTEKAKQEFLQNSTYAQYMMGDPSKIFLREQLAFVFETSDREVRRKVAELANYVPVLSLSKDKGYRVLSFNDNTPLEELTKMDEEIMHQIREDQSRIDNIKARMKPLVALHKVIEKRLAQQPQETKENCNETK